MGERFGVDIERLLSFMPSMIQALIRAELVHLIHSIASMPNAYEAFAGHMKPRISPILPWQ